MDIITQNYKRAIQRSITPSININECELNTSFIDSVLRITVLKKNNELSLQTKSHEKKLNYFLLNLLSKQILRYLYGTK